ncbi:MAG: PKD domain-containing protein [Nanoarchaeota archaeon]
MNLEKFLFNGIRNAIAAVAMAYVFTACPHPNSPSPPVQEPPHITPNAIVLPEYNSQKISSVTTDSITLSQKIDSLSLGKIIISDITTSTPQGLLRKVTGVSSDGKTLITENASLEEVVDNYFFSSTQELTPSDVRSVILSKGITPRSSLDLFNFKYDLNNVVLYDIDGNSQTTDDQINANGNISFNSKFDLEFRIENFELENLTFKNITADNINVIVTSPTQFLDMHKTYKIIHHDFKPFVIGTIPTLPPIPIIVTPKIDVDLDVYVKSSSLVTATLIQNADLTLGVSYSDNSWTPINIFNNNFNFQKPTLPDEVNISAVPSQELSLWLYDRAAGLYGKLSEYADFSSYKTDKIRWQIYGGLFGDIGIDMGIFKKFIPSYSKRVLQYDKLIDSGEIPINEETKNTSPFSNFSIKPLEGTTNTTFQFNASTSKDDEDQLSKLLFRWDWNDDGVFDTDWSSNYIADYKYPSSHQYGVTLQVKDSGGLTNKMTTWIKVSSP